MDEALGEAVRDFWPVIGPLRLVSGGQTGADRAALDWAIRRGIPHGGWCPRGRHAEDGALASRYILRSTPSPHPMQRTEWNVRDSDGTLIVSFHPVLHGGSRWTRECAQRWRRPWLHLVLSGSSLVAASELRDFVTRCSIDVLNVAGPRASEEHDLGVQVRLLLDHTWPWDFDRQRAR